MTDTFTPPIQPSMQGTQSDDQDRNITSKFGDAFVQDTPDGLQPVSRKLTLMWDPIQSTDATTIITFMEAHVGVPFYYTRPRDIAPRTWVCISKQRTYPYPTQDALTVMLEERFVY